MDDYHIHGKSTHNLLCLLKYKAVSAYSNNNTFYSQLKFSLNLPHVFSLTNYVKVVNIQITLHAVWHLIQGAIKFAWKETNT